MRYYGRRTLRFGPLYAVLSLSGGRPRLTSWGIRVGRFTHNVTRQTTTIDTPGVGYVRHQHGRKRRAR